MFLYFVLLIFRIILAWECEFFKNHEAETKYPILIKSVLEWGIVVETYGISVTWYML